ncbi:MAG: F0F1 ATP synthase subunit B [Anaerolineae bacterium]|jgi:F-type H+-transporting ATPase subunit b|nr:F0F1 ATP synthase subunit B [Anaerolineae bacterium]
MQKNTFLKRLLVAGLLGALLLAMALPVIRAQDATAEAPASEEQQNTEGEAAAGAEGEAAEEAGLLTPLGINSGLLFTQTFNFLLVAALLTFLLWRPAVNFLDARSARIQKGLEDAAAAAKARQNAEVEAEKIMAEARAQAAKEISEARARGEELAKSIQGEARTTAQTEADKIRTEAAAARNAELAGLRDQVLNISVALAGRILQENVDAKKQTGLVSDFFSKVPAAAKSMAGRVEIVSAMPLSDAEQAKARSEIGASEIAFSVDPSILGGLIVKSADKVIDGSVKSGLNDLAGRLN